MRVVALPAPALSTHCFVVVVSVAIIFRNGAIAASVFAVIVLRNPFFRLTQSLKCLSVLTSQRFSDPPWETVVTGLPRRISTRTLHLAGATLVTGSFVLVDFDATPGVVHLDT